MLGNPLRESRRDSARALLLLRSAFSPLRRLRRGLVAGLERARQRRALQRLSDQMLKDIGLTRRDAEFETGKPFWRP